VVRYVSRKGSHDPVALFGGFLDYEWLCAINGSNFQINFSHDGAISHSSAVQVMPAMKIALSSHPAFICGHRY
jgi:hypothetical protein